MTAAATASSHSPAIFKKVFLMACTEGAIRVSAQRCTDGDWVDVWVDANELAAGGANNVPIGKVKAKAAAAPDDKGGDRQFVLIGYGIGLAFMGKSPCDCGK